MTSGNPMHGPPAAQQAGAALDEIFRLAAMRRPDALALIDPPNRESFTDGAPRRLTYAQADRAIAAIAARIRQMRLPDDAVVAVQLPNIVETVLTVLGIMRAGLVAAPLPLLWRRSDCVAALSRSGAKAVVTCGRIGASDHCRLAMTAAARLFAIRYVCAFGKDLPDGIVGFDGIFDAQDEAQDDAPPTRNENGRGAGARNAIVTFDVAPDGPLPVARTHLQILAGGLAPLLESAVTENATILSSMPLDSFAGLCVALVPWLLTGGTLALHMPFDPQAFAMQWHAHAPALVILPGAMLPRMAQAGNFDAPAPTAILAIWRAPERLQGAARWHNTGIGLVDVTVFGEIGLLAARRGAGGEPAALALGVHTAPGGMSRATRVAEVSRTEAGTLGLRGPMVPHYHFPPGTARADLKIAADGVVDTGFPCRIGRDNRTLAVTGPQPGMIGVGGYRFVLHELQKLVSLIDREGTIAALPQALLGHRLAGNTGQCEAVCKTLTEIGVNPLIVAAFRDRHFDRPLRDASPLSAAIALTRR